MSWGDVTDFDLCGRCGRRYGPDDECAYHPAALGEDGVVSREVYGKKACCGALVGAPCCGGFSSCAWEPHVETPLSRAAEKARALEIDAQTREAYPRVSADAVALARHRVRRSLSRSVRFDYPDYFESKTDVMDLRVLEVADFEFLRGLMRRREFSLDARLALANALLDLRRADDLVAVVQESESEYVRLQTILYRSPPHRPIRKSGRGF